MEKHDLIDYLKDRNAYRDCPMCGTLDWRLLINEVTDIKNQQLMEFSLIHFGDQAERARRVPVFVLVCANCAFVRIHSSDAISVGFD